MGRVNHSVSRFGLKLLPLDNHGQSGPSAQCHATKDRDRELTDALIRIVVEEVEKEVVEEPANIVLVILQKLEVARQLSRCGLFTFFFSES